MHDVPAISRLIRHDSGLLHEEYTRRRATRSDIVAAVGSVSCLVVDGAHGPQAVALVMPFETSLRVRYLVGRGRAFGQLLRALAGEAHRRRLGAVRVTLPSRWWRSAERAGYRRRWRDAMLIYEKEL